MARNHNTKEFRLMRSVVIWLHSFACYICRFESDKLEVHHIDKDSQNNAINNLMPLCHSCHRLMHHVDITKTISYKKIIVLLLDKVVLYTILKNRKS